MKFILFVFVILNLSLSFAGTTDSGFMEKKINQAERYLKELEESDNTVSYISMVRKIHRAQKQAVELYLAKRSDKSLEKAWKNFVKKPYQFSIEPRGVGARGKILFLSSKVYLKELEEKIRKRVRTYGFKKFIETGDYDLQATNFEKKEKLYSPSSIIISHYRLLFEIIKHK